MQHPAEGGAAPAPELLRSSSLLPPQPPLPPHSPQHGSLRGFSSLRSCYPLCTSPPRSPPAAAARLPPTRLSKSGSASARTSPRPTNSCSSPPRTACERNGASVTARSAPPTVPPAETELVSVVVVSAAGARGPPHQYGQHVKASSQSVTARSTVAVRVLYPTAKGRLSRSSTICEGERGRVFTYYAGDAASDIWIAGAPASCYRGRPSCRIGASTFRSCGIFLSSGNKAVGRGMASPSG